MLHHAIQTIPTTSDILAENAANMPTPSNKPSGGFGCFFTFLAVAALMLFLGIVLGVSSISGKEFNPISFQTRTFSYHRMPWIGVRLSRTTLGTASSFASSDVLKHLPTLPQPPEWQVVELGGFLEEDHGASILVDALSRRNADGHNAWGAWSFENPNTAAVLWPLVQRVAILDLYECIPSLLEAAQNAEDAASFELSALETIADAIEQRIIRATEDGQSQPLLDGFSNLPVTQAENAKWIERRRQTWIKARDSRRP